MHRGNTLTTSVHRNGAIRRALQPATAHPGQLRASGTGSRSRAAQIR
jgi:hypothetical protein